MKKLSVVTKISIGLFLAFVILALAFTKPLYNRLKKAADNYINELVVKLSDSTGLYLSYEDFSPSILRGVKVENIYLKNADQETVLKIKNSNIDYHLLELIRGHYQDFVKSVTVDGVEIYIEKMIDVIQPLVTVEDEIVFDFTTITEFFPATVSFKNVILKYLNEDMDLEAIIKKISLHAGRDTKNFQFQMETNASIKLATLEDKITGIIKADGTIFNNLNNSVVHLTINDLTNGTYKLNKTNFIVSYVDSKFDVHTIQSTYPFYAGAVYDIEKNQVSAEIKMDRLNPMSVVSTHVSNDITKMLNKFKISMSAKASYNLTDNKFDYESQGNIKVPEKLLPGGADVIYSLSGNDKKLKLSNLTVDGKNLAATIAMDFAYKNLQASGNCNLSKFVLPNGNIISSDIYFDPLQTGFRIFAPEINIGQKALTAALINVHPGNDSIDFEAEFSDYSNVESAVPGHVNIEGSYLINTNYIQTSISLASVYVDSILGYVTELSDSELQKTIDPYTSYFKSYMFSLDAYLSTDFNSVLYNVTNLVLADTSVDNRLLFVSLNGNESSVQINHLNVIYDQMAAQAEISVDMDFETNEIFFTSDISAGSVPYNLIGTINPEIIKLNGNYGIDAEVRIDKKQNLTGYLNIGNLPFVFGNYAMIVSTESDFTYTKEFGPSITLKRFELEETDSISSLNPRLVLSGNLTQYGSQFSSVSYTDANSSLQGRCDINLNLGENTIDSAGISLNLKNDNSMEEIIVEGSLSNPDGVSLSLENITNSIYLSILAQINHFSLNRFTTIKNNDNEFTGLISLSGTVDHPFAAANVQNLSFLMGDQLMRATGSVTLEDRDISINDFNIDLPGLKIADFGGNISLDTVTGQLKTDFIVGENNIIMPMKMEIKDTYLSEGKLMPESFVAELKCQQMKGTLLKKPVDFDVSFMYMPGEVAFYSSENLGLYGNYNLDSGDFYASVNIQDTFSGECIGYMNSESMLLTFSDLSGDLKKLTSNIEFNDMVKFESGMLDGNFILGGNMDIPEFGGAVSLLDLNVKIPSVFESNLLSKQIKLSGQDNELFIEESFFGFKNNVDCFKTSASISFNKWTVDQMIANFETLKNQPLPLKFTSPYVNVSGEVNCNLDMNFTGNTFSLTGKAAGEKIDIVSYLQDITASTSNVSANTSVPDTDLNILMDIELLLGTHVMLNFNPILRCIFVPNTKMNLKIDSQSDLFQIDGQLNLKSGDVAYLNRSFYLKEGKIKFNPDEPLNPQVTLRAETRERDDSGQNVKIILSAENQYLNDFNPSFSSIPAKSENEIRTLLGQIVIADSDSIGGLLGTAGNYYLQSTIIRNIENKLRDLLNFDIFSVRTNVIQNAVNLGVSGNLSGNNISVGNFLDNSTVYIGKYFGSVLYVDAMLHLSAEDTPISDITATTGLLFQPEIGMELDLPVANIRWSMAPDINALINHQYVPNASLSLSWKFSF